jgi:hypothetical protein
MAGTTRTTYNSGPGAVVIGTVFSTSALTLYSSDDIKITEVIDTDPKDTSAYGKVGEISKERKVEVTFTPTQETFANILTTLWPYAAKKIGDEIFPQIDVPLTVIGLDGTARSYSAMALTKIPSLHCGMGKTLYGSVTFTCLGAGDGAWNTANSLVNLTGKVFSTSVRPLDPTKMLYGPAVGAWGLTPWNAFSTVEGFDIDFNLGLEPKMNDQYGIQNYMISSFDVTCKFAPCGITEANIAAKFITQGAASVAQRGGDIAAMGSGADLVITMGTTPLLLTSTIKGAAIKHVDYAYSRKGTRIPVIEMIATRNTFGGALSELFTIGLS